MDASLWLFVLFWVVLCGTAGYVIGPRKGYAPLGGLGIGALFGIFGVFYLAVRPAAVLRPPPVDAFQEPVGQAATLGRILIALLIVETELVALIGALAP